MERLIQRNPASQNRVKKTRDKKGELTLEKKIGFRLLSMLLSLVLVLELVPGSVWAAEDSSTDFSGAAETGIEVAEGEGSEVVLGEVDAYRDAREKHFRMADGSFLAVDYGMPVHFPSGLDEDGEPIWEDIDNTLTKMRGASTFMDTDAANSEDTFGMRSIIR